MVKIAVFIDTQLWVFALKIPEKSNFNNQLDYEKAIQRNQKASDFLKINLNNVRILMTTFQLCELFHVLAYRGTRLPLPFVQEFCFQLLSGEYMRWYDVNSEDLKRAIELSVHNKIHIWDYLCVLPLYQDADVLYSCDEHFKNDSFKLLGPSIENPIQDWMVL